jgi:hypothetical protein
VSCASAEDELTAATPSSASTYTVVDAEGSAKRQNIVTRQAAIGF